jgi:hypothetical protein
MVLILSKETTLPPDDSEGTNYESATVQPSKIKVHVNPLGIRNKFSLTNSNESLHDKTPYTHDSIIHTPAMPMAAKFCSASNSASSVRGKQTQTKATNVIKKFIQSHSTEVTSRAQGTLYSNFPLSVTVDKQEEGMKISDEGQLKTMNNFAVTGNAYFKPPQVITRSTTPSVNLMRKPYSSSQLKRMRLSEHPKTEDDQKMSKDLNHVIGKRAATSQGLRSSSQSLVQAENDQVSQSRPGTVDVSNVSLPGRFD